jgi:hypothetical protein
VRDGFEGIFDLVEAAFWREDGRLRLLLATAMSSAGIEVTLESYLRDMIAACSVTRDSVKGVKKKGGRVSEYGGELGWCCRAPGTSSHASACRSLGADHFLTGKRRITNNSVAQLHVASLIASRGIASSSNV